MSGAEAAEQAVWTPASRRAVLIAAILASSMGFIDGSVISIAIAAIRLDLGATLPEATWVSNGYLLMLSALTLLGGAAGDRFGLRRTFGLGIAVFVLASIVCALAPTPQMLIGARVVQGIGAAFMVPGSLAIIAQAYPRAERGRAIGLWAAASSITSVAGPILGGLLLTWLGDWSWRLVFAVNLPLGAAALALLAWRVPQDLPAGAARLDWPGAVLATLALLSIAFGLTGEGGTTAPGAGHIALWCGAGVVLGIAFVAWEMRAKSPMLPLRLFADRRFSGANGLTFALYFALGGTLFFLPMTMIGGWGETAATVSIVLLPMGVLLTLLSSWSGGLADKYGPAPLIAGGSLLVAASFLLLGLTAPLQQPWTVATPLVALLGLGMGLVVSPLSTAVMTSVDDRDTGAASGVNNAVARVSGLVAVALLGAVVAGVYGGNGTAVAAGTTFGLPAANLEPAIEAARLQATDAAFAAVCYVTAALALASAAIAWLTQERR
jgi:EmrB/QacA subfamily drug resistance transporter